jgi:hypothetical protein
MVYILYPALQAYSRVCDCILNRGVSHACGGALIANLLAAAALVTAALAQRASPDRVRPVRTRCRGREKEGAARDRPAPSSAFGGSSGGGRREAAS